MKNEHPRVVIPADAKPCSGCDRLRSQSGEGRGGALCNCGGFAYPKPPADMKSVRQEE